MSRKKSKQRQAVPEEILAEGSGPVGEAVEVEVAAAEVEPAVEVAAASEEPAKSRGRRKRAKQAVEAEVEVAASDADAGSDAGRMNASADADASIASADADSDAMLASNEGRDSEAIASTDGDDRDALLTASEQLDSDAIASGDGTDGDAMTASTDEADGDVMSASSDADSASAAVEGDDVVGDPITDEATVEAALLPGSLSPVQLRHLIEALIFATDKPVTLQRLRQLTRVSDVTRIEQALAELQEDYKDRGIALHQVSGGYQFRTNTAFSTWVQQLIQGRPVRLSRAQLETLAIVAYRQPITRPEIDEIRGVDSSATLRLLLDRSLIRVLGKREEVGRPTLYGTTKEFLDFFSLSDLRELPTLREYSELTAESRQVMSDRLGVPLDANGEPLEPEADDSLGDADDSDPGSHDQGSIVDSILAEHAAAEAEAELRLDARHEVGSDLAEAAMSGGSPAALHDIFSDEPDPDAMMMSGEISPAGSEARSYVDAIRAGALADAEAESDASADDVQLSADALSESESDPDNMELGADAMLERGGDAPADSELEAREIDPNDTVVLPHLAVSDDVVIAASEADQVSDELAVASSEAAATSDAVEVASEELLAASEDLAAVVADEVAGLSAAPRADEVTDQPHVGQASDANAGAAAAAGEVELLADEPTDAPHMGLTPNAAPADGDIEFLADEATDAPHVGQAPDTNAGANATTDEVQVLAEHPTDQPHVGQGPDANAGEAASSTGEVELFADEPKD